MLLVLDAVISLLALLSYSCKHSSFSLGDRNELSDSF